MPIHQLPPRHCLPALVQRPAALRAYPLLIRQLMDHLLHRQAGKVLLPLPRLFPPLIGDLLQIRLRRLGIGHILRLVEQAELLRKHLGLLAGCAKPLPLHEPQHTGLDGLIAIVRYHLKLDPYDGSVYVFRDGTGAAVQYIEWDGQGFRQSKRRAQSGRYPWPVGQAGEAVMSRSCCVSQSTCLFRDAISASFFVSSACHSAASFRFSLIS